MFSIWKSAIWLQVQQRSVIYNIEVPHIYIFRKALKVLMYSLWVSQTGIFAVQYAVLEICLLQFVCQKIFFGSIVDKQISFLGYKCWTRKEFQAIWWMRLIFEKISTCRPMENDFRKRKNLKAYKTDYQLVFKVFRFLIFWQVITNISHNLYRRRRLFSSFFVTSNLVIKILSWISWLCNCESLSLQSFSSLTITIWWVYHFWSHFNSLVPKWSAFSFWLQCIQ